MWVLSSGRFGGLGPGLAGDLDLGAGDAKGPGPSGVDVSFTPHPYSDCLELLSIHSTRSLKRFCRRDCSLSHYIHSPHLS